MASRPDERWSMVFMSDEMFDGRRIRVLTIVERPGELANVVKGGDRGRGPPDGRRRGQGSESSQTQLAGFEGSGPSSTQPESPGSHHCSHASTPSTAARVRDADQGPNARQLGDSVGSILRDKSAPRPAGWDSVRGLEPGGDRLRGRSISVDDHLEFSTPAS